MVKTLARRSYTYIAFAFAGLLGALILGRIELAVLGLPFLLSVLLSPLLDSVPRFGLSHSVSTTRSFEGDSTVVQIEVAAQTRVPLLEILDPLPPFCILTQGTNDMVTSLRAGQVRTYSYTFTPVRRGRFDLGAVTVRAHGLSGLLVSEQTLGEGVGCVAYPRTTTLRQPIRPRRTAANVGNYASRVSGEGMEIAGVRAYAAGDSARRINWRASLRSGSLCVTEFAAERNADIVLMLDSFADCGDQELNTLDLTCRLCATLANHFLEGKNRVGLIEHGGVFRWVLPALGRRQWYRILETLTDVQVVRRYASKDLSTVPRQLLPAQATILAITPLLDARFTDAVVDLVDRGHNAVLLLVRPERPARRVLARTPVNEAAMRLWSLDRGLRVRSLRHRGMPVLEWSPDEPLDLLARSVDSLRRPRGGTR